MKKNIIVTGGAGFIGSHIASRLINSGYDVTILDNLSTGTLKNVPEGASFIKMDLSLEKSLLKLKRIKGEALLHLAGQSSGEASFRDPLYDFKSHVLSTFWLLKWCKDNGVKRFMYASSMSTYGDPLYQPVDEAHPQNPKTFYGSAKSSAEAYIKLYHSLGLNTTIFRLFSVYGPGQNLSNKMQGMVSIYLSYLLENKPILVKGPLQRFRDLVFVDDVVDIWLASLDNPVTYGKVYNVASGKKTTVTRLLRLLKFYYGDPDHKVQLRKGTPGDQFGVVADISRISKDLKWSPQHSLRSGLKSMVDIEKRRMGNCLIR